ncbi:MAG TPA: type I methionyl aminopeptidase [Patescibacteria group bacterium]|jgi:methionyl aminopeptidase|nr:type I methionyl aminopeptidase [Patescibacteria group bacterium]
MVKIKNKAAIHKMKESGKMLAGLFEKLKSVVVIGVSTAQIDRWIGKQLQEMGMISQTKGYHDYAHVSCIAVNDQVVHGVPNERCILKSGDIVKVDVCAAYNGYCADMARPFLIDACSPEAIRLVDVAKSALDAGIEQAIVKNSIGDISFAIQQEVEKNGFGVVRDFAGHGIGKSMHEAPNVPNYGTRGKGIQLQSGMAFAIEPMVTEGSHLVTIDKHDGWTVRTIDGGLAAHIEDTVIVLDDGPYITTRTV